MVRSCDTPSHPSLITAILAQPRRANHWHSRIPVQCSREKYSTSGFRKYMVCYRYPALPRGAARDRHERGAGCGGRDAVVCECDRRASEARERLRRARRAAVLRTEKSCGSGAPWSASRFVWFARSPTGLRGADRTDRRGQQHQWSPGRARIIRKPLRGGCRMFPVLPL